MPGEKCPDEADDIFMRAGAFYAGFMKDMPDLGKNMMAKSMLDWFTILSCYETSGHRLDGEALREIKRRSVETLSFIGRLVDGNRHKWPYRLFERIYARFIKMQAKHSSRGEWMDGWNIELNPDNLTKGFCFHLSGCPIAKHAREHGYGELLPYL